MSLYDADHARISELIRAHVAAIHEALGDDEQLRLDVEPHGVHLHGHRLDPTANVGVDLSARLHAEGLRVFVFDAGFTEDAARRLVQAVHPYVAGSKRPTQELSDRLRWEPTPGLALSFVEADRSDAGFDVLSHAAASWRDLLLRDDPARAVRVEQAAGEAAWDCEGGAIQWPDPFTEEQYEALRGEVEAADRWGAPMARVGRIVTDIAEHWSRSTRLDELFTRVLGEVEPLLRDHRVGDAARFLTPLRRWGTTLAERPETLNARFEFERFQNLLLGDGPLGLLRESIRTRAIEPSRAASYLAGTGASMQRRVLEFAASLADGPYRRAVLGVLRNDLGDAARNLRKPLLEGPPEVAAMALQLLGELPASPDGMTLALAVVERPEGGLRRAAADHLMRYGDPPVSARMGRILRSEPELRSQALAYFVRHPDPSVWGVLRTLSRDARFDALALLDRCRVTRAMGFVDPERTREHAVEVLKAASARDPNLATPWALALAAAGAPEGHRVLIDLAARTVDPVARGVVGHAAQLWAQRHVEPEPEEVDESTEPPPAPVRGPGRLREVGPVAPDDEDDLSFATLRRRDGFPEKFTAAMHEAAEADESLAEFDPENIPAPDETWDQLPALSDEEEAEFHRLLDKLDPVDLAEELIDQSALEFETSAIDMGPLLELLRASDEEEDG